MMPLVFGVMAAATASGSSVNVSGSMSTNTGVAPVSATELPVAAKVNDGTMTEQAEVQTGRAGVDRHRRATGNEVLGELLLERRDLWPLCDHPASKHTIDRLALVVSDDRLCRGNELAHTVSLVSFPSVSM